MNNSLYLADSLLRAAKPTFIADPPGFILLEYTAADGSAINKAQGQGYFDAVYDGYDASVTFAGDLMIARLNVTPGTTNADANVLASALANPAPGGAWEDFGDVAFLRVVPWQKLYIDFPNPVLPLGYETNNNVWQPLTALGGVFANPYFNALVEHPGNGFAGSRSAIKFVHYPGQLDRNELLYGRIELPVAFAFSLGLIIFAEFPGRRR